MTVPSYVDQWVLATEAFPQSLWDELDAYLKRRSAKRPSRSTTSSSEVELFGDEGEGPIEAQPIRASTRRPYPLPGAPIRLRARPHGRHEGGGDRLAQDVGRPPRGQRRSGSSSFSVPAARSRSRKSRGIASDLMMIARLWVRSPSPTSPSSRLHGQKDQAGTSGPA